MAEPAIIATDAMVVAEARTRCERAGFRPDHPVHYEDDVSCRLRRDPIKEYLIGMKRRDGSIIEQYPTTPYWRWAN